MGTFTAMSDLMADAEDLLQRLVNSQDPEIQALSASVEASIEEMRRSFRRRLKAASGAEWRPWIIASAAFIATAVLMGVSGRRRRS
jgi:hypothetical protein